MMKRFTLLGRVLGIIMFWGWNIIAALVVLFLVLPYVFVPAVAATFSGEIPLSISVCLLILTLTPLLAFYIGVRHPKIVTPFFYGFEIPVFILVLLRIFLVRELTLASTFLLGTGLLAVGAFGWTLLKHAGLKHAGRSDMSDPVAKHAPGRFSPYVHIMFMVFVLITGVFVAILSALYALPTSIYFIKNFIEFKWWGDMFIHPLLSIILVFVGLSMVTVGAFPLYMAYYYPKMWWGANRRLSGIIPKKLYFAISALCVGAWVTLHGLTGLQPNADYVSKLDKMAPAEQDVQMQNAKEIRKKLLAAYLNEYRYLGKPGGDSALKLMYDSTARRRYFRPVADKRPYSFYRDGLGGAAQSVQNYLLSPMLYKGSANNGARAAKLYSELFDVSIQRAERRAISKVLKATYNRDEVTAGLMNIGARNVLLLEQNINFEDKGKYAVIEIEEAYENLTFDPQEIFYYFSLPEDAAITGLWIGRTPDRDKMDAFIVAPRGAAQKVYEQQVRRRIDPALLEQVGPRQYRLRVFPIPVTNRRASTARRGNRTVRKPKLALNPMRMHLRYVVPQGPDGFALPELLEKRNINWSRKTRYMLNGVQVSGENAWLPTLPKPVSTFGESWRLKAGFLGYEAAVINTQRSNLEPQSYAVLVDTSYSMKTQSPALKTVLQDLDALQDTGTVSLDYYITRKDGSAAVLQDSFAAGALKAFGTVTPQMMLRDFNALKNNRQYNGIIILTDQGRYAFKSDKLHKEPVALDAPLWFIHLGQAAFAYDDNILDAVYRSGGGVANNVSDLRTRMYYALNGQIANSERVWTAKHAPGLANNSQNPETAALAARQHILQSAYGEVPTPEALDILHDIAKTHAVVTPYSSMIVLVNERQKQTLKKASEADDRFDRQGRSGEEALTSPSNIVVSGVPEPHEWLLILLSLFMLGALWHKRDQWRKGSLNSRF